MPSLITSDEQDQVNLENLFGPLLSITNASVIALAASVRFSISGVKHVVGDEPVARLNGSLQSCLHCAI